ncbi:unnamed protein product [Caenorhabditis brenneri]
MKLIPILVVVLFPFVMGIQRICYLKIKSECQMELINVVATLPNTTRFPPLKNELDQYQAASETALKCALRIDCTKKYSAKEVYNQVAIPIGVRESDFEHQCITPVLAEVHTGSFVCSADHEFLTTNGTLNKELLLETKPCILTISKHVCSTEDHVFFEDNYDELMNMYTTKPDDEFGLCVSPYEKFRKNYCENMVIRVENNMKSLKLRNLNKTEANETSRQCEELQVSIYFSFSEIFSIFRNATKLRV